MADVGPLTSGMHRYRQKIGKQQANRRASYVAAESKRHKGALASSVSERAQHSRSMLEFERITAKAELDLVDSQLDLIEELSLMCAEDEALTVFSLFDRDGSGRVDARKLAGGLREVKGDAKYTRLLKKAADTLPMYDADKDGMITLPEFSEFLNFVTPKFDCTFHEVVELLVVHILFDNTPLGHGAFLRMSQGKHATRNEESSAAIGMSNERMMALFDLFDNELTGQVDFKEVAVCVYNATETDEMDDFTKSAWSALLTHAEEKRKSIAFPDFARLVENVVAAAKMDFNDVANSMTLAMCQPSFRKTKEKLSCLFTLGNDMKKTLNELDREVESGAAPDTMDIIQYRKIQRLFDLWDESHDGTISVSELALGMRKFHEDRDLDETVEDSISTMITFDSNRDGRLDRAEFSLFLAKLALSSDVEMNELLDFMVVTSTLKNNDNEERKYVETIGKKATKQIIRTQGRGRRRTRSMGAGVN